MPGGSNKNWFARRIRRGNEGSVGLYMARSQGAVALLLSDRRDFPAIARGSASGLRGTRAQLGSLPQAVRDARPYPFGDIAADHSPHRRMGSCLDYRWSQISRWKLHGQLL